VPAHESVAQRALVPPPEPLSVPVADAHTHLDACGCENAADVAAAMARARAVGVTRVVTVADDLESARWVVRAAGWHADLYAAVALHPTRADQLDDAAKAQLERLAGDARVVAIGETGLDHYWDAAPHHAQAEAFAWHIDLAKRTGKALQIHDRDAHEDVLRILEEEGAPDRTVLHCFSGDLELARRCVERGYHLSFAGTVTFKNAQALRNALAVTPLEQLLVETDAPYLTPAPHRGATNAPYLVPLTVRRMAGVLNTDVPALCTALSGNAERLYGPW
jgi:TatD DNase family protein